MTLDDIWERAEDGFYHSLADIGKDIEYIIKKTIKNRCFNSLSKIYLTTLIIKITAFLKTKAAEYKIKWRNYFEARYA